MIYYTKFQKLGLKFHTESKAIHKREWFLYWADKDAQK